MKKKQYALYVAMLIMTIMVTSFDTFAQKGKYGATDEDSVKCVESLSLYKDFMREKNYQMAKSYWEKAFRICPGSSLKMYVDGEKILNALIKENKSNQIRANELIDTLMLLYDVRIKHFDKEGYVLGKKGSAMYRYKRPGYQEAFNTLKRSIELDGNNAQAAAIIYYFQAAAKVNEMQVQEPTFWVEIFNQVVGVIDYNLALAGDPRKTKAYTSAMEAVIKIADPYLTCDVLVDFYTGRFEVKKGEAAWLESAANVLDQKGCADGPIFFKIANTLHAMNPSAASARNMGIMSIKKGRYSEAVKFFSQAINLADEETDDEHLDVILAKLELLLAKSYFGANNYPASRTHAQKAAGYKSGWGAPYMLIGDLYAGSISMCTEDPDGPLKSPYWVAIDMYLKAKSIDPSIASDASQKIAKYSQYFPTKGDAFFRGINEGDDYTVKCWINVTTKARTR